MITTRILWPNGDRINEVPLYTELIIKLPVRERRQRRKQETRFDPTPSNLKVKIIFIRPLKVL